jgi:peptide/nickel transport system substrate-binding protein
MSSKEHIWIPRLKEYLTDRRISRREFIRSATLLGMSAGAAYVWADKITGQTISPPALAQNLPKGGVFKIAMRVPSIDSPHTYSWIYDSNIMRAVCGYMTRTGHDNVTRPHLVEKWEASEDLKTWTLSVRDVKWHSGRSLTAEDLAWNIKHCLDPATGSSVVGLMKSFMLKEVNSGKNDDQGNPVMTTELWDASAIEVKDDRTLVLNLREPQVAIPEHLFHYALGIVDPADGGKFGVGSNGTEGFELVECEVGRQAFLKARKGYYGLGPHVDELHYIDLGDSPSAVAAAMSSKQVHGIFEGNIEQLDLYRSIPHVTIYDVTTAEAGIVRMQVDQDPFKDPRVRKAVRLATDQAKTLEISLKNFGIQAEHHHVCPLHPDYMKLPFMSRDLEAAKKLLTEAGYPDGIDTEITCKPDPAYELTAVESMVEQWKDAGIRCRINVLPSTKYWEVWDKVPFGFTTWAHRPLGFMTLALAYRTGVPWNETHYSNAKFDEILTKAEGTLDIDKRRELMGELEVIMQEDGPIAQPLWRSNYGAYDKRAKNINLHPTGFIFAEDLAIEPA